MRMARYGRQPLWGSGGLLDAPWDEVLAMHEELNALLSIEAEKPDPLQLEDRG